jgi:GMP synthase (glutamine-hydrolysing)
LDIYKELMTQETPATTNESRPTDAAEPLPFPFQQHTFCRYEPIEKRIEKARILVVDCLLRDEEDLSDVAREEWASSATAQLRRERQIANMAVENILNNVDRLVRDPATRVIHLSELEEAEREFQPNAIVLSGTLRDFDYYRREILESFGRFIRSTQTPVLAICGGHQLVGLSFGARVITLDGLEQHEQREQRPQEYQYRFIRITDTSDPIFGAIGDAGSGSWQDYTREARILRVWQNHGLQLDRVPDGFSLLATSYLCRNQMMVKRSDRQLIYTVQFHLEKSFEDWNKSRTRWEHPNESRDGRVLFENFLLLALAQR